VIGCIFLSTVGWPEQKQKKFRRACILFIEG
jgi:hypothetical protein